MNDVNKVKDLQVHWTSMFFKWILFYLYLYLFLDRKKS